MFLSTEALRTSEIYLKLRQTQVGDEVKLWVPAYHFAICLTQTDEVVGRCDLRIGHNQNTYYGGNIGYEVFTKYRGNHYAAKACLLLFQLAKLHEMSEVIITCDEINLASRKTCLAAGCEFEAVVPIPQWHDLYSRERQRLTTCRYIKKL
ncbi:MAG: GNAT family N-acetyltransferase [Culicoidibacterales bacterium]